MLFSPLTASRITRSTMQRLFIVGHPRSGTTIVQAMLGRHPDMYTLPETFFFERLYRDRDQRLNDPGHPLPPTSWRRRLNLTPKSARLQLAALARQLDQPLSSWQPRLTLRQSTHTFTRLLDNAARQAGRSRWAEKTPLHLLYLAEISRDVEDARFVHVLRSGEQVIASTIDAHLRYPGHPFSAPLGRLIEHWNRAAVIHAHYMGDPHHHFVFHDRLTTDPEGEWLRLLEFLKLDPQAALASRSQCSVADLEREPWKQGAVQATVRATDDKAPQLFGPGLRQLLAERLSSYTGLLDLHDQRLGQTQRLRRARPQPLPAAPVVFRPTELNSISR